MKRVLGFKRLKGLL